MDNRFFEQPVLNSPYRCPKYHWELDENHQPTQKIIEKRRPAEFITPIPKPRKQKGEMEQRKIVFDEGRGLSTLEQQYDPTSIINELRFQVDQWRRLPNPNQWRVTPEETYWIPGVNNNGQYDRWAFVEFTDVYTIESDFKDKVEAEFFKLIARFSDEKGVTV